MTGLHRMRTLRGVGVLLLATACGTPGPSVDDLPAQVDFAFHVKPILSDRCFKCHGPDDAARKAGLRLDTQDGAFATLQSGTRAVVPGNPRRSELVRRILSDDPDYRMPTPDSHLTLSDREKALLIRWIDQGAEWKPHWALTPPVAPPLPATPAGMPDSSHPIDRFVRAALAEQGLTPAPEASKDTLLRRLSLALTGLPPTVDEMDAFLADERPDAYERLVDRLLASPAYGERMAVDWLDLARFADSHGYQDDVLRDMSPWRDWVIDAFNRNLPIDQFITWQLAGDLLPNATREQRLATGFNRHHMQSQEGGIVPEEYRVEYVADRVQTFGRAFLGLSLDCARCHDHKYDPVLQREYFQLFAFFNSINESGQAPYSGMPSPTEILPSPEASARLEELVAQQAALLPRLAASHASYDGPFETWRASAARRVVDVSPDGLIAHLPLDAMREQLRPERTGATPPMRQRVLTFENVAPRADVAVLGGDQDRVPLAVPGHRGGGFRLVGDSEITLPDGVAYFDRHEPFSFALWFRIDEAGTEGPLVTRSGGFANGYRGYLVQLEKDGTLTASLHHVAPDDSITLRTTTPLSPGTWHHLTWTYDGSSRASGLRLFLDGRPAPTTVVVDNLRRSIFRSGIPDNQMSGRPLSFRLGGVGENSKQTLRDVSVDELRVYARQLSALEASILGEAPLPDDPAARTALLREHYVLTADPAYRATLAQATTLRREENELLTDQPSVMVMRELPSPRPTFILARGAYDAPTTQVEPGTPAALPPFPADAPRNRLGLAQWLVSPTHPLTARVFVNRQWAMLFGRGLVSTPDDFGSQGALPSHPALLDWLTTQFVASGWDAKALIRLIVTSATWRQDSTAAPALRERDPENVWLARGPAFRLGAEQIRDNALAASGLLQRRIGGPSVRPYQPERIWEQIAASASRTLYVQSAGPDLYRRSLYTIWRRTTPPPAATSFDASERLFCQVTRQRTSTPLQALVLLNDPQYVESARALAELTLREGGETPDSRVRYAFRRVTSRRPTQTEHERLVSLYAAEHRRFADAPASAQALLQVGDRPVDRALDPVDVAAWTVVTSTMLNLDAAVYTR